MTWGGQRAGAGRKPTGAYGHDRSGKPLAGVSHGPRDDIDGRHPVHVMLRAVPGTPSFQGKAVADEIGKLLARRAGRALSCRIVRFGIGPDLIHLVMEVPDRAALARAVQGVASGIARVVNRTAGGSGPLWRDRYLARPLRTAVELDACLAMISPDRPTRGSSRSAARKP
jgi:REP element-mobilizing transposase RayT